MDALTLKEAKELVAKHTKPIKDKETKVTLNSVNQCIALLKQHEYYTLFDDSNLIIDGITEDSSGELVYHITQRFNQ